jgi:hypothetical protein
MSSQASGSDTIRQVSIGVVAGLILLLLEGSGRWIIHRLDSHANQPSSAGAPAYTSTSPTSNERSSAYALPAASQTPTPQSTSLSSAPGAVGSSAAPAGVSAQYLTDLTPLPDDAPETTPQEMGGVYYAHSVSTLSGGCDRDSQNTFSYVINYKYSWFQATIGLNDQSLDGVQVQIEVIADSHFLLSKTFIPGQTIHLRSSIKGVREVKLEQTYLSPNPNLCSENATAVWGNAQVLP